MLKNITLSAEESIIRGCRERAMGEHTSLNALFRKWRSEYVGRSTASSDYARTMHELAYANAGKRFSRDEMNAR